MHPDAGGIGNSADATRAAGPPAGRPGPAVARGIGARRPSPSFRCGRRALLAAALAGCAGARQPLPPPPTGEARLQLLRRGWHSDIGLPAETVPPDLAALFPGAEWLLFGFGDRDYVLAASPGFGTALAALFPGPGAILVTGLRLPPAEAFPERDCTPLRLPPGGLRGAAGFVAASVAGGPIRQGPYPGSLFLPARQRYSGSYTCNTWTAEALAAAGLPVMPEGVLFSWQVTALATALLAAGYG
ncbi:DUF2459 domain-containing protein [Siccirubricoccus phaeus]|uniref:DUF2459 domain-containing protein n=1 Tax=Siccirubricoccus phaeus TaxID=2595053 RepID=UPI00165B280D|nr:DUF2459 domain-containing protein [Siccirubricoccus phaeus]